MDSYKLAQPFISYLFLGSWTESNYIILLHAFIVTLHINQGEIKFKFFLNSFFTVDNCFHKLHLQKTPNIYIGRFL